MRYPAISLGVVSLLLFGLGQLQADTTGVVAFKLEDQRLTLQAKDASLVSILERLAQEGGFTLYIETPLEDAEKVSVAFTNVSFVEGLQHILRDRNTMFVYQEDTQVLTAVHIFGARGNPAGPMPSGQPLSPAYEQIDLDAQQAQTARAIESIEDDLHAIQAHDSQEGLSLLQNLSTNPQAAVRMTALQWLAGRPDAYLDAMTTALRDEHYLVQGAATQLLLDEGLPEHVIARLPETAQMREPAVLRRTLKHLYEE